MVLCGGWMGSSVYLILFSSIDLTFCIQHLRDIQVFLCHLKSSIQVSNWVILARQEGEKLKGQLKAETAELGL